MAVNQPYWPRQWLMTDERIGDRLWQAIGRLPPGEGGIVFRHYSLPQEERRHLGAKVAASARERGLMLAVAGSCRLAGELGAKLVHNPDGPCELPISLAVHDEAEAVRARTLGADLVFVAPVHATRSHSGSTALGVERAAELAQRSECLSIALGGMDPERFEELERAYPGRFHGYAGIDCWLGEPSRK